nr:ABC transporter substrate-binding protein [Anaerolineae bacterium]
MSKRLIALLVAAVLVIGLVPAASAQEEEVWCGTDQPVSITWIAGTVGNEYETAVALAEKYMAEACPNVTVKVVERPTSTTETIAQYQQFFEGQSSEIDVYQLDVFYPAMFKEHLADISEYATDEFLGQFFPAVLEAYTVEGRLVGLPWFAGGGMLFYRADLLDKYGLAVPQTWDELAAAAKTIQDGERAEGNAAFWGFVFQGKAYEGLTCDALEWQVSYGGGRILSPEGVIEVNDPATIEIFDKIASWVGDIVPPEVLNFEEEDARAVWQAGNAAFMRNWAYAYPLGQAEDSPIRDKFEVAPLPGKEPGMSAATLGGWGIGVSRYSQNIEAASAFAIWVTSYDQLVDFHLARGEQPVMPALYEDAELLEALPYLASMGNVLESAIARPAVAGAQYNA